MNKKFKITLLSITVLLVGSILLGTSYSLWRTKYTQVGTNSVDVGCFSVTYTNLNSYGGQEAGDINLVNAYPITETAGNALTPYVFTIENTCSIAANYVVNLETLSSSTFNTDYLRVKFNEANNNTGTSVIYNNIENGTSLLSGNAIATKQLVLGYLAPSQSITYSLRTWIDIEATTETENVMGRSWNGKVTVESAAFKPKYEIVSGDLDTVGSIVKIADEEFYVIGQEDSTHVKLLSKWNLNVGNNAKGTATGLQDEDVRGYVASGTTYGTVSFSGSNYWFNTSTNKLKDEFGGNSINEQNEFIDSSNNVLYPYIYTNKIESGTYLNGTSEYIDNYVTYLNSQGVNVTGRLLKYSEVEEIANNGNSLIGTGWLDSLPNISGKEWIYSTSYWIGNAATTSSPICIETLGIIHQRSVDNYINAGVRPVIILSK